jgi:hypothetical protein
MEEMVTSVQLDLGVYTGCMVDNRPQGFGKLVRVWGRCYDHNFLRFLTFFGEKNWRFSQKPML